MRINDAEFLRYYWEELLYLRRAGQSFARTYPKVAARLELQGDECPDPHVERLIESFAFLTARIQRNLDNDFPEIAGELLDVLYPHYLAPIPSMAVARFDVDPERGKLTSGYTIPRHTKLFAHSGEGAICRWRTAYPVTLWPIEVTEAAVESPDRFPFLDRMTDVARVLRVHLTSRAEPFEKLEVDQLRFHLDGDPILVAILYEMLMDATLRVAVCSDDEMLPAEGRATRAGASNLAAGVRYLPPDSIAAAGFSEEESLLPYPPQSHIAYRLIQEYFSFPQKYHFVDVKNLRGAASGNDIDLLFLLDRAPRSRLDVAPTSFVLGCTPIVNLFEKTSEPIRIDHRRLEYRLVGDARREKTTEVHSILSVSGSANARDRTRDYAPFYAWSHQLGRRVQRTFWHARRVLSLYEGVAGTETLLSFVDLDFKPTSPPAEVVWAHALCTNRVLAAETPAHALLQTDVAAPVSHIVCLKKPTQPVPPPLGGETLWPLVSHLSLNYLSLCENAENVRALQSILRLYSAADQRTADQQIGSIRDVGTRKIVRRYGDGVMRGFCRGSEVSVTLDESAFVGGSAFLFATVLNHFFALWSSTNSFTQFALSSAQRKGVWKRWPPMAGGRIVL
jgi:type VI secretion system protein ImpG